MTVTFDPSGPESGPFHVVALQTTCANLRSKQHVHKFGSGRKEARTDSRQDNASAGDPGGGIKTVK